MVNFYIPDRLLASSTGLVKLRQTRVQKLRSPGIHEYYESRAKNKFADIYYFHQPTVSNRFFMLFLSAIVFISLSFFTNKVAFGEEKDIIVSDSLRFKIIGDQEAPAVRYFVPWKTPEQDEMLPVPTPDLQALDILDPHELRREIDYYSILHTPGIGNRIENTEDQLPVTDVPETESIEQKSSKTMSTEPKTSH